MPTPLPCGPTQFPVASYGRGPGGDTSSPIWLTTVDAPTPAQMTALLAAVDATPGFILFCNLAGSRTGWTDPVNGKLHFNLTKYTDKLKRWQVQSASNPGGCSAALAASVTSHLTNALGSRRVVCYVIDEPHHTDFDGTIPTSVVNNLAGLHKQFWPGCITVVRSPVHQMAAPVGGWTNLDYGWAQYGTPQSGETIAAFFDDNKTRFAAMGLGCIKGCNWMGQPDGRLWDHDLNGATADRRVAGLGGTLPAGTIQDGSTTTNRAWMMPPDRIKEFADVAYLDLDLPAFSLWTDPNWRSDKSVWLTYWDRSDFRAAWDYMLNKFNSRASWTGWRTPKDGSGGPPPPPPPPPATNVAYGYNEQAIRQTTASTSYVNVPGVSLPGPAGAVQFVIGRSYLIKVVAQADVNGVGNGYVRVAHGSTAFADSEASWTPQSATSKKHYSWFTVWVATAEAINLQFKAESPRTIGIDQCSIFALDLSNLTYQYNQNLVSTALGAGYSDGASVTFTPAAGGHDWLVMSQAQYNTPSAVLSIKSRINHSVGATTDPEVMLEGEDAVLDIMPLFNTRVDTLAAVAHTFKEQSANTGGGGPRVSSEIFLLDLNQFASHAFSYNDTLVAWGAVTPFETNMATCTITPTADAPVYVLGGMGAVVTQASRKVKMRLQIDNVDAQATQTSDDYAYYSWDPADILPMQTQCVKTLTGGAGHIVDVDASVDVAGAGKGGKGRHVVAFQLSAAGGGVGGNNPPVWDQIFDINVKENDTVDFFVNAVDPDVGDVLTYGVVGSLPSGCIFDAVTRRFTWTPNSEQAGSYVITLRVGDGDVNVDTSFTINVLDVPSVLTDVSMRTLRYDFNLQGPRFRLQVRWNGAGDAEQKQGIVGLVADMREMGR